MFYVGLPGYPFDPLEVKTSWPHLSDIMVTTSSFVAPKVVHPLVTRPRILSHLHDCKHARSFSEQ